MVLSRPPQNQTGLYVRANKAGCESMARHGSVAHGSGRGEGGGAGWQCEKPQQSTKDTVDIIREMSGGQIFWLVSFIILALAAGAIATVQTVRLRRLQSGGDNEKYGELLHGSE